MPLFRLSYINTGELVMAQFIIPDQDNDQVITAGNRQVGFYWTKFLNR